ncbi:MAG TPA: right-handed parallel beta-helix repeat-containing protein [Candidatus Binatia bacterium]
MRLISVTFTAATLTVLAMSPASARTIVVGPSGSIQAAVDQAQSGDRIVVRPGTYHEAGRPCPTEPGNTCAVVIDKDGIALVALGHVVLENAGGQDQGFAFAKEGADGAECLTDQTQRLQGALVSGFTVNGFGGDGIFLFCADDWKVVGNAVHDNAEYGIFPSHCGKGVVALNVATGSNDTGIYIGQSHDVRVDLNVAHGNVSGFELENCSNTRMDHNESDGNTAGILTFTNIFLDVKQNANNRVDHNLIHDNNEPNTCLDPTDEVCAVPPGSGLLVLAADANLIDHNAVFGNDSFGIAVANYCVANNLSDAQCAQLDIEPNPDFDRIVQNVAFGNGTSPSPLINPVFAVDLAWDGTGIGNCWKHNRVGTQFPDDHPACS